MRDADHKNFQLYFLHILISVSIFALLTVVHSWISFSKVHYLNFVVPIFAGLLVGYLMAKNKVLNNQLTQIANTDKLTGAYNRRYFDTRLNEEVDKARRYKLLFSIIYMDLDLFKQVNDTFGHEIGDHVLIDFSEIVMKANRDSDIFARFGGEEFIILVQMADKNSAHILYERIKNAVAQHQFQQVNNVTFSAGIAEFDIDKDSVTSILERADVALYKAKSSGRNRAVIAD